MWRFFPCRITQYNGLALNARARWGNDIERVGAGNEQTQHIVVGFSETIYLHLRLIILYSSELRGNMQEQFNAEEMDFKSGSWSGSGFVHTAEGGFIGGGIAGMAAGGDFGAEQGALGGVIVGTVIGAVGYALLGWE